MKIILKDIKVAFCVAFGNIYHAIVSNYIMLVCILIAIVTGITATRFTGAELSYFLTYILQISILLALMYVVSVSKRLKKTHTTQLPVLKNRITYKIGGEVRIDKEDWQKAVIYLSNIEDYIERNGLKNE